MYDTLYSLEEKLDDDDDDILSFAHSFFARCLPLGFTFSLNVSHSAFPFALTIKKCCDSYPLWWIKFISYLFNGIELYGWLLIDNKLP